MIYVPRPSMSGWNVLQSLGLALLLNFNHDCLCPHCCDPLPSGQEGVRDIAGVVMVRLNRCVDVVLPREYLSQEPHCSDRFRA